MKADKIEQFNRMRTALLNISKAHKPSELKRMYILSRDYKESLEEAYLDLQHEAAEAVKYVRELREDYI